MAMLDPFSAHIALSGLVEALCQNLGPDFIVESLA